MTSPAGPTGASFVDLHMHSTASDGSRSPTDVVRAAKKASLVAIALTDHDSVAGLTEARAAGLELGVRVVSGIELSAVEGEVETHVLGLHLRDTAILDRGLVDLREMRHQRARQIVDRLNELGVTLAFEDVLAQAGVGVVGRPHVARAMIAEGWATDARDAFDRYLGANRPAFVAKEQLSLRAAISMIQNAGGLAVLAHPGSGGTRDRIDAMRAIGLDGIEVKHPSHSSSDTTRLRGLCEQFGLVMSGGSDWHGAADGPRTIGMMQVPSDWLARQDAQIEARGRAPAA